MTTPSARTRDFGMTCPTPMLPSPPVRRHVRDHVTMVSEAVQTESELDAKLSASDEMGEWQQVEGVRKSKHPRGTIAMCR